MHSNVFVIIPAYNEGKRIEDVLIKVKRYSKNVVVVDDGSKDNTYDIALSQKVVVLKHIVNLGKGAALKTGCDYALKNNADIIVVIDADGQHDPKLIPKFLDQLTFGSKIVFGYRRDLGSMPFVLRFGNWLISYITKLLYGINILDTQNGYRAFTRDAYTKIRWNSTDYSMESEMIANLGKHKMNYSQIPIPTIYHDNYKGTTVLDGIKIMINLFLWRFGK